MPQPNELCAGFRRQADWVWQHTGDAFRLGIGFNEETMTEMVMLNLARQFSGRGLEIKTFTKHEEGTSYKGGLPTAADWEFRFENASRQGITLRTQAKRLYMRDGNYGALDGAGTQIRKLVANSGNAIPLYVLYNGPSPHLSGPNWRSKFPFLKWNRPQRSCSWPHYMPELWGCAIAAPHHVPRKSRPRPIEFTRMEPWHMLVCNCRASAGHVRKSLPEIIGRNLEAIFATAPSETDDGMVAFEREYSFEPNDQTPGWASMLLEGLADIELPEGIEGVALIRELRDEWHTG
jgi:hypothetical protein